MTVYKEERPQTDLNTCDLEPIHIPGSIQPFGAILAGPPDMSSIDYCSANVETYLGAKPEAILGSGFADLLGRNLVHDLRNHASLSTALTQRERVGSYRLKTGRFDVYLHVNPNRQAVVEFEPIRAQTSEEGMRALDDMRKYLAAASARADVTQMLRVAVSGLAAMTGYDRVMAYRYEDNGDGEVVAEQRNPKAHSMLGLRFPGWDVPQQARELQIRNPVRMLTDVDQTPVGILTHDAGAIPLDLSLAHLRGISEIHVEYLRNMGVAATLTIGLVVEGRLWGMFALHHLTPHKISSDTRIATELFGQMMSLVIKQKLDLEAAERRNRAALARRRIEADSDAESDLLTSFTDLAPILADVIDHHGLAIRYDGKTLTHGRTPPRATIVSLLEAAAMQDRTVLPIENLGKSGLLAEGTDLGDSAGALIVRGLAARPMELVFFRDEHLRTLNWAGKPDKEMESGPLGPRITPRGSFDAYVESARGFAPPWSPADLQAGEAVRVMISEISAKGERAQLDRHRDLASHQRQQDLMIAELNHRVKNILALIRSLTRQARASSASLESYALALEQRISALAAAHDLAVSNSMGGVSIRDLLTTELGPYVSGDSSQVLMTGPRIGLRADVAPMIALVLHEIVSNAAKYGALSTDEGLVRVKWSVTTDSLHFVWKELGGPPVTPPSRHGFGRSLVEKAIPFELDGEVDLSFDPQGLTFSFSIPASNLAELEAEQPPRIVGPIGRIESVADGRKALLVEDNLVLAMDMVDSLTRLGASSVDTAGSLESGLKAADRTDADFGVLDMNLRGTVSFDIARKLMERGIPFLFVTGYGSSLDIPEDLREVAILSKPIDEGAFSNALQKLLR